VWQTYKFQSVNFYKASFVGNRQKGGLVKLELSDDSLQCFQAPLCFYEISLVDFKSDKFFHAAAPSSDGGISNAEKRIEHRFDSGDAVQFDAPFGELNRKRRGMRPLLGAALNRLVRNEPGIAAATQIASASMTPAGDVAFVLVRYAKRKPIKLSTPSFREMKNVLMAIVKKPFRIDRLEVTVRFEIALSIFNCDRLDPVNRVLQKKSA
jgi:hypothetical protein